MLLDDSRPALQWMLVASINWMYRYQQGNSQQGWVKNSQPQFHVHSSILFFICVLSWLFKFRLQVLLLINNVLSDKHERCGKNLYHYFHWIMMYENNSLFPSVFHTKLFLPFKWKKVHGYETCISAATWLHIELNSRKYLKCQLALN